jgi:hypothetical protein
VSESKQVYLLEDLRKKKGARYLTADFNLYAFAGAPTFGAGETYVLKVGTAAEGEGKDDRQAIGEVEFAPIGKAAQRTSQRGMRNNNEDFADDSEWADNEDELADAEPIARDGKKPVVRQAPTSPEDQLKAWKAAVENLDQASDPTKNPDSIVWIPIESST